MTEYAHMVDWINMNDDYNTRQDNLSLSNKLTICNTRYWEFYRKNCKQEINFEKKNNGHAEEE